MGTVFVPRTAAGAQDCPEGRNVIEKKADLGYPIRVISGHRNSFMLGLEGATATNIAFLILVTMASL